MAFWVLIILLISGIVAFVAAATSMPNPDTVWAMLSANFTYFLGITQAGVIFSAIMRLSKSPWGVYFARLGEILTLSFIPVAIILFGGLYLGGFDYLFFWGDPHAHETYGHISPWLNEKLFLCRIILSNAIFYIVSYIYFRMGRAEELNPARAEAIHHKRGIVACFMVFFFVIANTFVAWDFGMTIIPHWESSIYAPAFWVSNLVSGISFLFLMGMVFIPRAQGIKIEKVLLGSMGKVFFGFVLLWIYIFWSQHIVFWYGNLPQRMVPAFRQMWSPYTWPFTIMMFCVLGIPFFALLFRRVKLSGNAMSVVAIFLCVGIWLNRYLLIVPVYSKGEVAVLGTGTGIAITAGVAAATILSIMVFRCLFPKVTFTTGMKKGGH